MNDFKIGDRVKPNPNKRQSFAGTKLSFKAEYIIDSEPKFQVGGFLKYIIILYVLLQILLVMYMLIN